jgi:hypothetical protein
MTDLEVTCYTAFDGWNCHVTVTDGKGKPSEHSVALTRADYQKYNSGSEPRELVEASFRFLLEREPKESILPRFKLSDIERYFPDYPGVIAGRTGK